MKKKLIAVAGVALLLAGCSAQPKPAAELTPTFDDGGPSGVACRAFATEFPEGFDSMNDDSTATDWTALAEKIDAIALKAEGDVKDRMLTLVDEWPDMADIFLWGEIDDFNSNLAAIERACEAAGEPISGVQLVTS